MAGRLLRSISMFVLAAALVALAGAPSAAKGGPQDATRLFVRTTDRGVTVRVYRGNLDLGFGSAQPCHGLGCPPAACAPRGSLVIGFSTDAAVGQGWAQLYARGHEQLQAIGAGGFGFEFDAPAAYVVAQTGPDVDHVRMKFRGGGSDEMRPTKHLVVLAAPMHGAAASIAQRMGPSGTIDAFDGNGTRVARRRFSPSSFSTGQPEQCVGGLEEEFPAPKGDPPADEAAVRFAVAAAFATAYGPGLTIEQRAELIEDGAGLVPVMKIAADKNPQYRDLITAIVEEVRFIDATHAATRFSLEIDGSPVISGIGRAVLVDGQWLVARDTYCGLQQLGGAWCPARGKGD